MSTAREIHLSAYPDGMPTPGIFKTVERDLPAPKAGQAEVEVLYYSVDPYMRGRMRPDVKSYIPPFALNEPLDGGAVVRVVRSEAEGIEPGDVLVGMGGAGWRDRAVVDVAGFQKVDASQVSPSTFLGALGMPGLTAWAGLTQIIAPKEGETLYVSGAAGAVGSLVCQLGKARGMTVLGSAGGAEKCAFLKEKIGVDHAFDYREHDAGSLAKAILAQGGGVDGYFENVGGMQLEALLNCMNVYGRIAVCGMIAQYNDLGATPGPSNLPQIIGRQLKVQGFIVSTYQPKMMEFLGEVMPLVASGKVVAEETVFDGVEAGPEAFIGLFEGRNTGKAVVKVAG